MKQENINQTKNKKKVYFDRNYFGILRWKTVMTPMKLNHQLQKYSENINRSNVIL